MIHNVEWLFFNLKYLCPLKYTNRVRCLKDQRGRQELQHRGDNSPVKTCGNVTRRRLV